MRNCDWDCLNCRYADCIRTAKEVAEHDGMETDIDAELERDDLLMELANAVGRDERRPIYNKLNPERYKEWWQRGNAKYYEKHREEKIEKAKRYYQEHKAAILERRKEKRKHDRENWTDSYMKRIENDRAYYKRNREKILKRSAEKRASIAG